MTQHYIIMGICGCGKTTVAEALQQQLHCPFAEGDVFHTQANRDKMGAGIPLNDDDRRPWLERLRDWMSEQAQHGARHTIVTCSALKRSYRDILRQAQGEVHFVHLSPPIAANRAINEDIHFVVGHVCSGATIAAAAIYDEEGVLMITPSATAPALTDGKNYEYIFRVTGRDDQQGPAAARYILDVAKPKKVAILHDKQSYGQGIANAVRVTLEKAGLKPVLFEGINAGDADYSAIITKLRSQGVDFVYYGGYHPEMGLLLRQAAEQGVKAKFMGPEGAGNPDINAIAGNAVEGMLLTLPKDFSTDPANAAIVKAFQAKKRDASGAFQLSAYAAVQAIVDGIKATGSDDPEQVAKWLHANTVKTPVGELKWTAQGDLESYPYVVYTWHKDGSKTLAK